MVENRIGLAVLPESVAIRYQASMEVQTVSLEDSWAVRDLRALFIINYTILFGLQHTSVHKG
jgi:hypothetical protein